MTNAVVIIGSGAFGFIDWLDLLCSFFDGFFRRYAPRPILFHEIQALIGGGHRNFLMSGSRRKRRDLENGLTGRVRGDLNDLLEIGSRDVGLRSDISMGEIPAV